MPMANGEIVDDIAFLNAIAERMISDGTVDSPRIYVVGVSNGGLMAFNAACAAAEPVRRADRTIPPRSRHARQFYGYRRPGNRVPRQC